MSTQGLRSYLKLPRAHARSARAEPTNRVIGSWMRSKQMAEARYRASEAGPRELFGLRYALTALCSQANTRAT